MDLATNAESNDLHIETPSDVSNHDGPKTAAHSALLEDRTGDHNRQWPISDCGRSHNSPTHTHNSIHLINQASPEVISQYSKPRIIGKVYRKRPWNSLARKKGESPLHKCDYCDRTYAQAEQLESHKRYFCKNEAGCKKSERYGREIIGLVDDPLDLEAIVRVSRARRNNNPLTRAPHQRDDSSRMTEAYSKDIEVRDINDRIRLSSNPVTIKPMWLQALKLHDRYFAIDGLDHATRAPNQLGPSRNLELLGLPSKVHHILFEYLDPIDSVCFGLTNSNLYRIHRDKHGTISLEAQRIRYEDTRRTWRLAAVYGAHSIVNPPLYTYCHMCAISPCKLHRHLRRWMGQEREYCEVSKKYGRPAGDDTSLNCYNSSPQIARRCGRHHISKSCTVNNVEMPLSWTPEPINPPETSSGTPSSGSLVDQIETSNRYKSSTRGLHSVLDTIVGRIFDIAIWLVVPMELLLISVALFYQPSKAVLSSVLLQVQLELQTVLFAVAAASTLLLFEFIRGLSPTADQEKGHCSTIEQTPADLGVRSLEKRYCWMFKRKHLVIKLMRLLILLIISQLFNAFTLQNLENDWFGKDSSITSQSLHLILRFMAPCITAVVVSRPRWNRSWQAFASRFQWAADPGYVRIGWSCKCGKRLQTQVPERFQRLGTEFARKVAGADDPDSGSVASSTTDSSSTLSFTKGSSSKSSSVDTELTTDPSSLEPSLSGLGTHSFPKVPKGTGRYMLLCVNSSRRLIKLANVDVTDYDKDTLVFGKLRENYLRLRGKKGRNPFIKPKTMHFIEFNLMHIKQTMDIVSSYRKDCIPSIKEVMNEEYEFNPCPPEINDLPMDPDVFLHFFMTPGCPSDNVASEMLPKKLHSKLFWDCKVHNAGNKPRGWGFYIVEGIDWEFTVCFMVGMVASITVLTVTWSVVTADVQGGTGIGQYCLGGFALLVTVFALSNGCQT